MRNLALHDLEKGPQKALLAGLIGAKQCLNGEDLSFDVEESMEELKRLAETLDLAPLKTVIQERPTPDPHTYFGKGKVAELGSIIEDLGADVLLVNGTLSPGQAKNLEEALGVEVMDRQEVILKIFAKRARSKEGKLQVQLAALRYQLPRLAGHGMEMSNQGGGIGTRGPGEKKLEEDRRTLRERIARIQNHLKKTATVREGMRKTREESGIPKISLVGYTNVGKSTLFKALTGDKDVFCDARLFATLDPWVRKWQLSQAQTVLLVDTVGFIQGLPHDLVASFRSTLEESLDSNVIIHVVDVSSRVFMGEMTVVENVLKELGAHSTPRITCFNKIDRAEGVDVKSLLSRFAPALAISALNGIGLDKLEKMCQDTLNQERSQVSLMIPYSLWSMVHEIRNVGTVLQEVHGEDGAIVTCKISQKDKARFQARLTAEMRN